MPACDGPGVAIAHSARSITFHRTPLVRTLFGMPARREMLARAFVLEQSKSKLICALHDIAPFRLPAGTLRHDATPSQHSQAVPEAGKSAKILLVPSNFHMLLVLCLSKILSITQLRVSRDFYNNYSNLLALGVHVCPNGVSREPLAF